MANSFEFHNSIEDKIEPVEPESSLVFASRAFLAGANQQLIEKACEELELKFGIIESTKSK